MAESNAEEGRGGKCCPYCGSEDIRHERDHGDTICYDCGWYTEQGSPSEAVDWGEIHAA